MPSPDPKLREQLKAVREQISDVRSKKAEALKERDAAKAAFSGVDLTTTKVTESPEFKAAEQAVKAVGELEDQLSDLKQAESSIVSMLGDQQMGDIDPDRNPALEVGQRALGWDANRLLAMSSEYKEALGRGVFNSKSKFGTIDLGEIAGRDEAVAFMSGRTQAAYLPNAAGGVLDSTVSYIPPDFRGVIPPRLMPLDLLDLIPTGTTDSNTINYVQVTAIPGSAAETAEHAVKPQEGLTTVDATAPVRTIAGWIKASRQSLDDVAGLSTMINTLLPYDVRRRILFQVLAGDGTGQNILGLYNTTGVNAPAQVAGDNIADAILRAVTQVVLSDSDPNFIAVNPITQQNLLLMRWGSDNQNQTQNAAAFQGGYLYGNPAALQAPTIWGLRITTSRAIPAAHPIVGDAMGCSLLFREGVNIRTSDADQDDFIRNRVTVLAEARCAFVVWRPSAFAIVAQGA